MLLSIADPLLHHSAAQAAASMADPNEGAIVAVGEVQTASSNYTAVVAVGDVKTHLPSAEEILSIKKLATQTKAIGIILPPPDIRAIIDKTSQFVAKHGARRNLTIVGCMRPRFHPCSHRMVGYYSHGVFQVPSSRNAFWGMRRTMSSSTSWYPQIPTMLTTSCG